MLKLKRIELVGFKSFYDRAEIAVGDNGVTAVVGPNGCGKSNISDAIAWVLGEQSAKSLRGEKMEDVIFNGTRNRAPMGMAEVTLHLMDVDGDPLFAAHDGHRNGNGNGNGAAPTNGIHPPAVAGPRELTVQRRLYRSGESIYLLNGKPCRLRDVQDVFLGTGLGHNSYAIIEQGRVGQLLSSKPSDRRGLIEEAAGITKFKAKRKLAESRLDAARLNLSRVNDILVEVDRQRNSLRRQAAKARRFLELRKRLHFIDSAMFSTRAEALVQRRGDLDHALSTIHDEGRALEGRVSGIEELVHARRDDADTQGRELVDARARHAELELEHERAVQRGERLRDQIRTLDERKGALAAERQRAIEDQEKVRGERSSRRELLEGIEAQRSRTQESAEALKTRMQEVGQSRSAEERAVEDLRRRQFEIVGREARLRNEIVSRNELIVRIDAQIQRLEQEAGDAARQQQELASQLDAARDEHSLRESSFGQLKVQLRETEEACLGHRAAHAESVRLKGEARARQESIRHRMETIGEIATQRAYGTESVQQFFNEVRQAGWAPLGLLADFVDVEPGFEAVVENFLRRELQYVVVGDRGDAERALAVVREVTKGRLDCLVLNGTTVVRPPDFSMDGCVPLTSVLRFDDRVRHITEHLDDAFIVDSMERAWILATQHPKLRFVTAAGDVVQGHLVSGGLPVETGPLTLKRELRELDRQLSEAVSEFGRLEGEAARMAAIVNETESQRVRFAAELQDLEKQILTTDHRVRTLTADVQRVNDRIRIARSESERHAAERHQIGLQLNETEVALTEAGSARQAVEAETAERTGRSEALRAEAESLTRQFGEVRSELAVLEERRSAAEREIALLERRHDELEQEWRRAEAGILAAETQQQETLGAVTLLDEARDALGAKRDELGSGIQTMAARQEELRRELHEAESRWDESRAELDAWKDRQNALEIERTQVDSDLKHLSVLCSNEIGRTIETVCIDHWEAVSPETYAAFEQESGELRERLEGMGAVNMMAVEEFQEAEDRFEFLTVQRQDLLDSIRDTQQAIDEIDVVCRKQFQEAYDHINAGFTLAFTSLFGGGHGELRLLEGAEDFDAGIEIVAQPPGKKLQNVLLLSGGEKALTALALLIALFRYRPSPFCVLDEVDAPLDDANVDRFAQMVRQMSDSTQFIVITHSKRTMETANALYGVTMEEPGISKVVSVRLN